MERLIEYVTQSSAARRGRRAGAGRSAHLRVAHARIVFAAISSQDLIRLMNQGALVLDIRKPDEFAPGHVNGAKQLPSTRS